MAREQKSKDHVRQEALIKEIVHETITAEPASDDEVEIDKVILKAVNSSDLELAINWLRLNRAIQNATETRKKGRTYVAIVNIATELSEVIGLVNSKFGSFVVASPFENEVPNE